jgi:predicted nucleic-acid-binding protein
MKITADTNVLVRAVTRDDQRQARIAAKALREAEVIAIALPSLCEFVWVMHSIYSMGTNDIATAIRSLLATANVVANRPAAEAGLAVLEAGGDFADAAIAYEGDRLGGEVFVSFDSKAVSLLQGRGVAATRL